MEGSYRYRTNGSWQPTRGGPKVWEEGLARG